LLCPKKRYEKSGTKGARYELGRGTKGAVRKERYERSGTKRHQITPTIHFLDLALGLWDLGTGANPVSKVGVRKSPIKRPKNIFWPCPTNYNPTGFPFNLLQDQINIIEIIAQTCCMNHCFKFHAKNMHSLCIFH
jgi:hypothetical protein